MKPLLLTLFSLFLFAFSGQCQNPETPSFPRVQLGVMASPDLAYRFLTGSDVIGDGNPDGVNDLVNWVEYRNETETPKLGFSAGFTVQYNVTRHIGIQTGGRYSNKGYQTKQIELIFQERGEDINAAKQQFSFEYIDLPLLMKFRIGNHPEVAIVAGIGGLVHLLINESSTMTLYYEDGSKNQQRTFRDNENFTTLFNVSPTASLGFDCKLSERMNLYIEPSAQIFLFNRLSGVTSFGTERLWSVGLQTSLLFAL